jgi:CRP-like cAMP-binding protein
MKMNKNPEPAISHTPRQNRLLAALPAEEYARLLPHLELVPLEPGWALYERDDQQRYVYFPTTCIMSKLYVMEDGQTEELAVVGNCGVVGMAVVMGGDSIPFRTVVQSTGYGYRLRADVLIAEFKRSGELRNLLLHHAQAVFAQLAQTAACCQLHTADQRRCRWLLMSLDRLPSNELTMNQGLIATMMGVAREDVDAVMDRLSAEGLIRYARGKITLLDRRKLEARVCECYAVVKREYERLLPYLAAT